MWFSSSDARLKFSADVYSIGEHAAATLTDAEGIARFTVTAIKGGLAYITFEADGVEKKITVMVTD